MSVSYKEKLSDNRWKLKRDSIVERDSGMCRKCQSTEKLQVHHCYYEAEKEPWDYDDLSLLTLCRNCHEFETSCLNKMKKMLTDSLSKKGMLANGYESLAFAFECSTIWPDDKMAWEALSWAIRTPEIMNTIISHYQYRNISKNGN